MDDVIEFNACDKADDFKGKERKEDLVDYVHQGSGGESKLQIELCDTREANLSDPRQVSEVDLEKLIISSNNLEMQQKEKLMKVLLRYTEFLTTRPGKLKVYEYRFNITDTTIPAIPDLYHTQPEQVSESRLNK